MVIPWAAIIKGAQNSIQGTTQLASGVAASASRANIAERKMLKADLDAYKRGRLGMSDAEQNQIAASGLEAAQAAQSGAIDAAQRQAAANASGGGNASEAYRTLGQIGEAAAGAGAQARSEASALSSQQAQQRAAALMTRVSAAAAKNREGAKYYGALAGQAASGAAKSTTDAMDAQKKKNVDETYDNAFKPKATTATSAAPAASTLAATVTK